MDRPIAYIEGDGRSWRCDGCGSHGRAVSTASGHRLALGTVAAHVNECTPQGADTMHQPSRQPERTAVAPTPPPPAEQPRRLLPAHIADELQTAQTLVHARHADVAQARADLAREEAALGEAIAQLNKVVHSLLQ